MNTKKIIELYGRRFTPSSKVVAFIAILIFGVLMAFKEGENDGAIQDKYENRVFR